MRKTDLDDQVTVRLPRHLREAAEAAAERERRPLAQKLEDSHRRWIGGCWPWRGCVRATMETQATKGITPKVRAELDSALERQRSLQAGVDALSLDAVLDGKAKTKLDKLEGELAGATASVVRLQKALAQAEERDLQASRRAEIDRLRDRLGEFAQIAAARSEAAADLDRAAEALNKAYLCLDAANVFIESALPAGWLPRGYRRPDLHRLVRSAIYRASSVSQIGETAPGGITAPSFSTTYAPKKIPTTAAAIGDQNRWVLEFARQKIETSEAHYFGKHAEVA